MANLERIQANNTELQECIEIAKSLPDSEAGEYYTGEYEVTPKVKMQTLGTKEKVMKNDVTIKEIPYAEVTNLANGKTVTIGSEV